MAWNGNPMYTQTTSDPCSTFPARKLSPSIPGQLPSQEPLDCAGQNVPSGRRILHKKSASDTFAFAAGSYLENAPGQDIYKFLNSQQLPCYDPNLGDEVLDLIEENDLDGFPGSPYHRDACQRDTGSPATSKQGAGGSDRTSPLAADADGGLNFTTQTRSNALDPAQLDPKRAKRIIANRQSAYRSRMKKLQYIHELENNTELIGKQIEELSQEAERLRTRHTELLKASDQYAYKVTQLQQQMGYQEALGRALKGEINRLRAISEAQQRSGQAGVGQSPNMPIPAPITDVNKSNSLRGSVDFDQLLADVSLPQPGTFPLSSHDSYRLNLEGSFLAGELFPELSDGSNEAQQKMYQYGM